MNTNKMSQRREEPDISGANSGNAERVMTGKTGKMLFNLIVVFGVLLPLASCVAPVTTGPNHFGIGIYNHELEQINPDVNYEKVEGVGLLLIDGRLSFGYTDHQVVSARLDGCSDRVQTPLADYAVGEEAENIGIDFIYSK